MENRLKLSIAIVLNMAIVILQIIFGLYAHSMALITDAVHNFQDVVSLIIAYIAILFMAKKPTEKMTFGYLRSEVMAGFINSAFLLGAVFLIITTSIERIFEPVEVESVYVIVMGGIAFVINAFSAWLLGFHHGDKHDHQHEDLNIKAAYLHLLSDAGISLGVVVGGIVIYFYGINWVDPVISILFSLYILRETLPVVKKSYMILMESVPPGIETEEVKKAILQNPKIVDVHDIHIWALSSKDIYLSVHVVFEKKEDLLDFETVLTDVENSLKKLGIHHITIQPEIKGFKCETIY
ncbi:cobalt-zinc-cadmium efflux system protein [Persephonella hydrogeniphila]|uniref:Cobalt-zinc-cadmium efflux system protein n=1 Tax=Persephonella hydrogeniphila TaxID=198703 RepID=A0A285MYN3_9AQUI|nr:cation diffusion facilitator family transporter [Persephonella hydrogeniphila]SNZ02208.1 cobalt-zinc-cadmium efflux system protein [Persephonella hydrogeniphila]